MINIVANLFGLKFTAIWPYHYHQIQTSQLIFLQPEAIANNAPDPVAVNGTSQMLLTNNQTQTCMIELIGCVENEQIVVRDFFGFGSKYRLNLILAGQSVLTWITILQALRGLLHDGGSIQHDHFWWPYGHENHGFFFFLRCWVGMFFSCFRILNKSFLKRVLMLLLKGGNVKGRCHPDKGNVILR